MKKSCGMVTEMPAVSVTADGIKNTGYFAYGSGTISSWEKNKMEINNNLFGMWMRGLQIRSSGILL